nr:MAG TPA: Penaeidin [Caudoviricetes sp.]
MGKTIAKGCLSSFTACCHEAKGWRMNYTRKELLDDK